MSGDNVTRMPDLPVSGYQRKVFTDEEAQQIAHAVWNHLAIDSAVDFIAWKENVESKMTEWHGDTK